MRYDRGREQAATFARIGAISRARFFSLPRTSRNAFHGWLLWRGQL